MFFIFRIFRVFLYIFLFGFMVFFKIFWMFLRYVGDYKFVVSEI